MITACSGFSARRQTPSDKLFLAAGFPSRRIRVRKINRT